MEEDLPKLPRLTNDQLAASHPINPTKKRVRHSSFTALSSDPAIFSSDDDPSAENYLRARRKKHFRGPWYQQVPASDGNSQETPDGGNEHGKKSDRKFERKYDSGVFMGSDGTDLDEVLDVIENKQASTLPVRQLWTTPKLQPDRPRAEIWVEEQIQKCLEDGNESIDLSARNVPRVTNAMIRPLSTFTIVPPVSQDVFQHLEPSLKIFLSQNLLKTLPEELFYLDRLTALSLRSNLLRELPSAIGNLSDLRELNLALNRLEYLPYEILNLFSDTSNLRSFTIHPNPFVQPHLGQREKPEELLSPSSSDRVRTRYQPKQYVDDSEPQRLWSPKWKATFQARTDVRYFNKTGALIQGPAFTQSHNQQYPNLTLPTVDPTTPATPPPTDIQPSRTPSLLELSLSSCMQSSQATHLSQLLPDDTPSHLLSLLDTSAAQKESGFAKCTICNRKVIIKRTEWIEWWEISLVKDKAMASAASPLRRMENERDVFESRIPLVRRGCSWACGPRVMRAIKSDEVGKGNV